MATNWVNPNHIIQFSEPGAELAHISWDDSYNFSQIVTKDKNSLSTKGSLQHIARSPKHDLTNKTYFLRATNFYFTNLPNTIAGIEVRINVQRYGRATDDTIQLCLNDKDIGENQASLTILPEKIYGGLTNLWGLLTLSKENIEDPSFGVTVRYKAHPDWPHSSSVLIDSIEMRIH